jgi:uncharacterized protein
MKSWLPACAALLLLTGIAPAADLKSLKPQGYLSDFAGVVDAQSRAAIEEYAARVQQATGVQLAFVVLPSLQGEALEDVTNDIFHAWGIGRKKEDDGAMLLLTVADRRSRLEVGGGLGGIIPDGMAGQLLDEMRPALRQGQYGPALLAAAEQLGSTIAKSKKVTIAAPTAAPEAPRRVPRGKQDSIPWSYILVGIFILLLLIRRGGTGGGGGFWTGLLLGQLFNSVGSSGGRGGGGFGGFDSGGSGGGFGGFGGGDSAGGGASSGW